MEPRPRVPKAVQGGGAVAGSGAPSAEQQWDPPGAWLRVIAGAPLPVASPQTNSPPALHAPLKGFLFGVLRRYDPSVGALVNGEWLMVSGVNRILAP